MGKKDPQEISRVLKEINLSWTEHNNGVHWKIRDLGLDIWPTRWKTMHKGVVRVWYTMEDFMEFLGKLRDGCPVELKDMSKRRRRRRRNMTSNEGRTIGPQFNEADWQSFRQSGLLPW